MMSPTTCHACSIYQTEISNFQILFMEWCSTLQHKLNQQTAAAENDTGASTSCSGGAVAGSDGYNNGGNEDVANLGESVTYDTKTHMNMNNESPVMLPKTLDDGALVYPTVIQSLKKDNSNVVLSGGGPDSDRETLNTCEHMNRLKPLTTPSETSLDANGAAVSGEVGTLGSKFSVVSSLINNSYQTQRLNSVSNSLNQKTADCSPPEPSTSDFELRGSNQYEVRDSQWSPHLGSTSCSSGVAGVEVKTEPCDGDDYQIDRRTISKFQLGLPSTSSEGSGREGGYMRGLTMDAVEEAMDNDPGDGLQTGSQGIRTAEGCQQVRWADDDRESASVVKWAAMQDALAVHQEVADIAVKADMSEPGLQKPSLSKDGSCSPHLKAEPMECSNSMKSSNKTNGYVPKRFVTSVHTREILAKYISGGVTSRSCANCRICGQSFTHRKNSYSHVRTHFMVQKFTCELCGNGKFYFTRADQLFDHEKLHHGSMEGVDDVQPAQ